MSIFDIFTLFHALFHEDILFFVKCKLTNEATACGDLNQPGEIYSSRVGENIHEDTGQVKVISSFWAFNIDMLIYL